MSAVQQLGKVGVLYGGRSSEREVSLMSGKGVYEALLRQGVDAHLFDTGTQTLEALMAARFDRVFIALHGRHGEDGVMQGVLEALDLPYTGSAPLASALAMDKIMTKRVWLHEGIPTPEFRELRADSNLQEVAETLGLPLIMKPPHEGSTMGVTKVTSLAQMQEAYALAAQFDEVVLAERFVQGRELTVAVLGRGDQARALPIIEIKAPDGNYDYQNKYFSDETQYLCPAELDPALTARIQDICERAYRAVGCEGWGRVDLMLSADNEPFVLEVNTSPGMTGHSLVPMAAQASGISYDALCLDLLKDARCKVAVRTK